METKCSQSGCDYKANPVVNTCPLVQQTRDQAVKGGYPTPALEEATSVPFNGPYWPREDWLRLIKRMGKAAEKTKCDLSKTIRDELAAITREKRKNKTLIKKK